MNRNKIVFESVLICVLFLVSCTTGILTEYVEPSSTDSNADTDSDVDSDSDIDTDSDTDGDTNTGDGCEMMDILFVIDSSDSMEQEQEMLIAAFPDFIDALEDYNNDNTDKIDYRLGVTTPSIAGEVEVFYTGGVSGSFTYSMGGDNGEMATSPLLDDPWVDGPGDTAFIIQAFTDIASVGLGGHGVEMPLRAMTMALEKTAPGEANEGFLRDNALFTAVIITDEDDCSMPGDSWELYDFQHDNSCLGPPPAEDLVDLDEYRAFLDNQFGDPARYVISVVAGAKSSSTAHSADRLIDFVENHVVNGVFYDICEQDLAGALAEALIEMEISCDEIPPPV